jgi:NUMOD3 motif
MLKKFYVYSLIDPRKTKKGRVFYIGKATTRRKDDDGARARDHLRQVLGGYHDNPYLSNTINKILKDNLTYGIEFLFSSDDESKALEVEKYWIEFYGRKTLCNLTDGGDGGSGFRCTDETKAKLSAAHKGKPKKPFSDLHKLNMSLAQKGKPKGPRTPDHQAKLSLSRRSQYPNLVGQTFTRLCVISQFFQDGEWWCDCSCTCGTTSFITRAHCLRVGQSKSCGCVNRKRMSEMANASASNLVGQVFGHLTVSSRDMTFPKGNGTYWLCECDCGNNKTVNISHLLDGTNTHCGCLSISSSGYVGVYPSGKKYRVRITVNGNKLSFGTYSDKLDAARVYNSKAIELLGPGAYQNPIPS